MAEPVGVIPAAGLGTRLGHLPCSKEIYPIAFDGNGGKSKPTVAIEHLLGALRTGGVRKAFVVLREGKWDIPAFLGDGHRFGMHLSYLMMRLPFGQAYSVDAAYPFVREATVLLGFPDILLEADDPFGRLLEHQARSGAEVALGLFPARRPERADMVELDDRGRIRDIVVKPERTSLRYTWIVAVWSPAFTEFLHDHVAGRLAAGNPGADGTGRELYVGDVVRAAVEEGWAVEGVLFENASYIDIGTPHDLRMALRRDYRAGAGRPR